MSRLTRPLVARGAASLVLLIYVVGISANGWLERRLGLQSEDSAEDVVLFVGFSLFAAVGSLLVAKRPENPIGWIMSANALIVGIFPACESYAAYVMSTSGHPDVLAVVGVWANSWYWYLLLALTFIYLPLLFPDGRLPSRRWLPVAVVPAIGVAGIAILGALTETLRGQTFDYRIDNPIGIEGLGYVEDLQVFTVLGGGALAIGTVGSVSSVVVRFRRSRGTERQQLKWFLYAAAPIVAFPAIESLPVIVSGLLSGWVLLGLPTAIGIAVLRYRLYEIDLVINRTLVYGSLTVMLALVYVGGVAITQMVFRLLSGQEQQPQLAVVISTLVIAAIFNPLRRRVQGLVDRRFYRRKYDAAKTLAAFNSRLREETDLGSLSEEVLGVVRETMQPAHVSLWLRPDTVDAKEETPG
jgi:hypothetical protein